MTKNKVVKKFRDASTEYYQAAKVLEHSGMSGTSPNWFLYRHSLELALKAAVIVFHSDENIKNLNFEIATDFTGKTFFDSTHSIKRLLSAFFKTEHTLLMTHEKTKDEMMQLAVLLDDTDPASSFFRYPFSKEKQIKENTQSIEAVLGVENIAPEIKPRRNGYFLINDNTARSIKFSNLKLIEIYDAILKIIAFIFPKAGVDCER